MELKTADGDIPMVISNEKGDKGIFFDGVNVKIFGSFQNVEERMNCFWKAREIGDHMNPSGWRPAVISATDFLDKEWGIMLRKMENEVITGEHGITIESHNKGDFSKTYRRGDDKITFTYKFLDYDREWGSMDFSGDCLLGLEVLALYRKYAPRHKYLSRKDLARNLIRRHATEISQQHAKDLYDKIVADMEGSL